MGLAGHHPPVELVCLLTMLLQPTIMLLTGTTSALASSSLPGSFRQRFACERIQSKSGPVQVEGHHAVGLGGHHQPVELVFLPAYGTICSHLWFGLGNLLVGFSSGRVLVLGTDPGSISQELFSRQMFEAPVAHMSFCPYAARAGKHGLRSFVQIRG